MATIQNTSWVSCNVQGIELVLHPLGYVYWPEKKTLICADLHIGKGGHFRKNGVAIPVLANKNNFWNLSVVFDFFKPNTWIVVGDMVHSTENSEWKDFVDFLDNYPDIDRILVKGNHEIYADDTYRQMGFSVHNRLDLDPFILTHDVLEEIPLNQFNLCGHLHPAVRLVGDGRQTLRASCFYFGKNVGYLPACGEFTGTSIIRPVAGDQVFVIANNTIIEKSIKTSTP
ncbi:MAG: ligase-associated DNA damage response endonuclease PdeM [Flavobacteriales bacterium]